MAGKYTQKFNFDFKLIDIEILQVFQLQVIKFDYSSFIIDQITFKEHIEYKHFKEFKQPIISKDF